MLMNNDTLVNTIKMETILHNMIDEARRDRYDSFLWDLENKTVNINDLIHLDGA